MNVQLLDYELPAELVAQHPPDRRDEARLLVCDRVTGEVRHRSVADKREVVSAGWLPRSGDVRVGLTSGASTPDNLVEIVVRKLEGFTQP